MQSFRAKLFACDHFFAGMFTVLVSATIGENNASACTITKHTASSVAIRTTHTILRYRGGHFNRGGTVYNDFMSQITLNLPDTVAAELAEASREANSKPEDVARDLLERALRVRRFDRVRKKVIESLGPDAPKSDEDVHLFSGRVRLTL